MQKTNFIFIVHKVVLVYILTHLKSKYKIFNIQIVHKLFRLFNNRILKNFNSIQI